MNFVELCFALIECVDTVTYRMLVTSMFLLFLDVPLTTAIRNQIYSYSLQF